MRTEPLPKTGISLSLVVSCILLTANGSVFAQAPESGPASQETMRLRGLRVLMIIAEGYHEHEFWFPYYRFKEEGAEVTVAGPTKGIVLGTCAAAPEGTSATAMIVSSSLPVQRPLQAYLVTAVMASVIDQYNFEFFVTGS